MEIIYLRHAETEFNAANRWMGAIDHSLNNRGIEQARSVAAELQSFGISQIFTSPLKRSIETAKIVAVSQPGECPVYILEGLRERDFGIFEGKTKTAALREKLASSSSPEQSLSLTRRLSAALETVLRMKGRTLLVSHSSVFQHLIGSMGYDSMPAVKRLGNAEWVTVRIHENQPNAHLSEIKVELNSKNY